MILPRRPIPRFQAPAEPKVLQLYDFSSGMNTRDLDIDVPVRSAQNVRLGVGSGFVKRAGQVQKGNRIGTGHGIDGLHSYVRADRSAFLLASWNGEIYDYSESGSSPVVVSTSTSSQATGYGKDRHVAFTAATDAQGNPYLAATYQSGSGIMLRTSAYPYTAWSSATTVDSATTVQWSLWIDAADNLHVAYASSSTVVKYVKLTYSAGPSYAVGTKQQVNAGGTTDSGSYPTVALQASGRVHVAYVQTDTTSGTQYVVAARYSEDAGVTWTSAVPLGTKNTAATRSCACVVTNDTPYFVVQEDDTGAGTAYVYNQFVWNGSYLYQSTFPFFGTQTLAQFSVVQSGLGIALYDPTGTSANGVSATSFGGTAGSARQYYSSTGSPPAVQYYHVTNGTPDATPVNVTNDANTNKYPSVPLEVGANAVYVPAVWTEGTSSSFNVKVNTSVTWIALSASLTAGKKVESAYMPLTGAGGTNSVYFVNGTDACKRWDGSTLTTASASGYPVAHHVVAFDNRLWFFGAGAAGNRASYTNLGADNFSGTFPSGNTVDFPEYAVGGFNYQQSQMLVFTTEAIYTIQNFDYTGANVGPEEVTRVPNSFGTLSIRTVRQIGYWVYFQSPDGMVRRTNGQYVETPECSDVIRPTIASYSLGQLANAAAGISYPLYKLSMYGPSSGTNNMIPVLDTRSAPTGGWTVDTGQNVAVFCEHPDANGVPTLYAGDSVSGTVYLSETGTSDNGAIIAMDVETGTLFGKDFFQNILRDVQVTAQAIPSGTVTLGVANALNVTSFSTQEVNVSSGESVWGSGTWGDGRNWGGNTLIQTRTTWNLQGPGFKLRVSDATLNESVSVDGLAVTSEDYRGIT